MADSDEKNVTKKAESCGDLWEKLTNLLSAAEKKDPIHFYFASQNEDIEDFIIEENRIGKKSDMLMQQKEAVGQKPYKFLLTQFAKQSNRYLDH